MKTNEITSSTLLSTQFAPRAVLNVQLGHKLHRRLVSEAI
jgi:hypothetical protein